jgi:hypothetical protein
MEFSLFVIYGSILAMEAEIGIPGAYKSIKVSASSPRAGFGCGDPRTLIIAFREEAFGCRPSPRSVDPTKIRPISIPNGVARFVPSMFALLWSYLQLYFL